MRTDSSKAHLELILLLSLPRAFEETTCVESGNMKNLSSVANRTHKRMSMGCRTRKRQRTIGKILRLGLFQSQIVDPSVGRIVLRLPIELFEKVGADNRQLSLVPRGPAAHGGCKREGEDQGEIG